MPDVADATPLAPGLGWRPSPDVRDSAYPLRALMPRRRRPVPQRPRYWAIFHRPIDQGDEATCVGHGLKHRLIAAPIIQSGGPAGEPTALDIYLGAIGRDEWRENDWGDLQFGTSVRAGCEELLARGLISAYHWAEGIEDVREYLYHDGPLVVGSWWYSEMSYPDEAGRIRAAGLRSGGHCYVLIGMRWEAGWWWYRILNSWGPGWGDGGRAWIREDDLARLLFAEAGEAAAIVEIRPRRSALRRIFPWLPEVPAWARMR